MARIQYQRSAQPGSYRPQQVDDRNIQRMRDESRRVIESMQRQAQVEIENRERVSRAMKENAAITARQEERNFQIQTQNSQNTLNGLAAQARRDQEQAAVNQKATASIFESISNLSSTASKVVNDIQLAKKKEEFDKEFYDQDPNANAITQLLRYEKESRARIAAQARLGGIQEAEANGADPLTAAKLKENDSVTQYDFTEATVAKFFKYQYLDVRTARLAEAQKEKGTALTYDEKKAVIAQLRQDVYDLVGAAGLSADLVKPHLEYADQLDTRFHATEQAREKKESDERRSANHIAILNNTAPEKRQEVFNSSFPHLVDLHGFEGALNILDQQVFNVQDPKTGEFLWSAESVAQTRFPSDGRTVAEKYTDKQGRPTGRYAALLAERVKLENQFRTRQATADRLSHMEFEDQALQFLSQEGNATAKNVRELQRMYSSIAFKESDRLKHFEKHLTYEAQHRERVIQQASQLRNHELTPEVVAGVCSIDPIGCKTIKDRADQHNAKWKSEGYEDTKKALEKKVSGTTTIGTIKSGSNEELRMVAYLHAELEKRTAQYEPALGFEGARLKAGDELEKLYDANYRNNVPGNIFYRKPGRSGVSYPYLPRGGDVSAAQQVREDVAELRATSVVNGLDQAIANYFQDNPERLEYIKNNYDKSTFQPTPQELALVSFGNGIPLHTVYNKGFASAKDPTVLESPLKSNGKEIVLTPAQLKIINNPLAGPEAKMSVIQSVFNPSSFQDPSTMRPGSPVGQIIGPNTGVIVTDPADGPGGTDAVIKQGQRGAKYSWPVQGQVLKVVNDRSTEYRLEEGATKRDFGNHVEIRFRLPSGREVDALVSHFDKVADLKPGDTISPNTFIGTQGRSGSTTGAHVSFDFYQKGTNIPDTEARDWFLKTHLR